MPDFQSMFGSLLYYFYNLVGQDYGYALILFTLVVKLILTPLNIKQIKSTMKTQKLQPELKKLQDRYKNDKEKLNEEMIKFFKENDHNPASGCLPSLVQLPILLLLWRVISQPITTMLGGGSSVPSLKETMSVILDRGVASITETDIIFNFTKEIGDKLTQVPAVLIEKIYDLQNGMHFLGIFNLAKIPVDPIWHWTEFRSHMDVYLPLLIIPLLATLFTYISSKMMMANTPVVATNSSTENNPMDPIKMQKSMLLMGPIMTLIFSFQLPAGLGLYWLAGYVYQIFQQMYINKTIHSKKVEIVPLTNNEIRNEIKEETVEKIKLNKREDRKK